MQELIGAAVDPTAEYTVTRGNYRMSSDKVIAEIAVSRAEFNAAIAEVNASIDAMSARLGALEATMANSIGGLEASTIARLDSIHAQLVMLTWVTFATLVILSAMATTGWLHMLGWWPRAKSEPGPASSEPSDERFVDAIRWAEGVTGRSRS